MCAVIYFDYGWVLNAMSTSQKITKSSQSALHDDNINKN